MPRSLPLFLALLPGAALAQEAPPMPANMTGAAEVSFAVSALALVLMLGAARWLVARR